MTARSPSALIEGRRVIVCVGTGGVGKTTIAAALAVEAARRGRRALVLTIDPARRLADAMGVGALGNEPRALPAETLSALGIGPGGGVSAMMLDMKRTFDDLVDRFAEDDEARDRILQNPIYQHVSDALAGSAEYAAMEKVFEMSERDDFDVIVLDTPPSQHALDFLDAPQRLMEFLDSRLVQMLLHPAFAAGRFGFRLFHRAAQRVFKVIERVSGVGFLEDISEFLLAFEGMSEGFRERARSVQNLLLGPEAGFVLVAGPTPEAARSAGAFLDHLDRSRAPLDGVVVNRMRVWPGGPPPQALLDGRDLGEELRKLGSALEAAGQTQGEQSLRAARAAVDAAKGYALLVELDARTTEPLQKRAERAGRFSCCIPELAHDVHDLEGLVQVARFLFAPGQPGTQEP